MSDYKNGYLECAWLSKRLHIPPYLYQENDAIIADCTQSLKNVDIL